MRLRIVVPSMLVMTISAALHAKLHAQAHEPQLPPLTRGVTHETRTINVPGLTAATSGCPISDDPTYGVTAANPIKVGGDMLYVAARSMRYLQALRGPSGEGLHFWRLGSFEGPDGTMLDVYQVEHDGTVHHLYVDGYRIGGAQSATWTRLCVTADGPAAAESAGNAAAADDAGGDAPCCRTDLTRRGWLREARRDVRSRATDRTSVCQRRCSRTPARREQRPHRDQQTSFRRRRVSGDVRRTRPCPAAVRQGHRRAWQLAERHPRSQRRADSRTGSWHRRAGIGACRHVRR